MCMGRKIDGLQCTRRRLPNSEYCKSHCRKLPNGRIDEPNPLPKVKAKRGRKRKVEFDPRQNDDEYVTLWEKILEGEKYLVDIKGHVFTYQNENLMTSFNMKSDQRIKPHLLAVFPALFQTNVRFRWHSLNSRHER